MCSRLKLFGTKIGKYEKYDCCEFWLFYNKNHDWCDDKGILLVPFTCLEEFTKYFNSSSGEMIIVIMVE